MSVLKNASTDKKVQKMKPAYKRKWLKALRSGKYAQTKAVLKDGDGYCCLGVLREIVTPGSKASDKDYDALCKRHSELVGLPVYSRDEDPNIQCTLAEMNDAGKTFIEIADWIEQNL